MDPLFYRCDVMVRLPSLVSKQAIGILCYGLPMEYEGTVCKSYPPVVYNLSTAERENADIVGHLSYRS
jgi:hypothetical protein